MAVINDVENEKILVISDQGFGKRTDVEEYRKTSRHAKGVKTLNVTDKTGKVVALLVTKEEEDLMIINKSGTTIRMHMDVIKETKNRVTQGTKVIELKKRNDEISHVCIVPREDDEEEVVEQTEGDPTEGAAEDVTNPTEE
jgi:DNA gyrase subunit A